MAGYRCGCYGLILGFLITHCVTQDATTVRFPENENAKAEGTVDSLDNERTGTIIDINGFTLSDVNSTESVRSKGETTSFIELYSTTSKDVESQPGLSDDLDSRSSTVEFPNNDYSKTTNSNDNQSSSHSEFDDLLNASTSRFPISIAPNNVSTVHDGNENDVLNWSVSFSTENASAGIIATTTSYDLLSRSERTDNTFAHIKDVTIPSLSDNVSTVFSSPAEPNLLENENIAYSNESNDLAATSTVVNIYDTIENKSTISVSDISSIMISSSTLGLPSLLTVQNTGDYNTSTSDEENTTESSFESNAGINRDSQVTITIDPVSDESLNRNSSHSAETVTVEPLVFPTPFTESNTLFISTEITVPTEMQDSSNYSFVINSTSSLSSNAELSSFEENKEQKSSVKTDFDSMKTESYDNDQFISITSEQSTPKETTEFSKSISDIGQTVSDTSSDGTSPEFHHSSSNINDDFVDSTSSPFMMLNVTVATTTDTLDVLDKQSSSSITDNDERFPLIIPSVISNTTSSPDNTSMNSTESEGIVTPSYSEDIVTVSEMYDESNRSKTFGLTESHISNTTLSESIAEYNDSALISTTSIPSHDERLTEFTSTTSESSTAQKTTIWSSSNADSSDTQLTSNLFPTGSERTSLIIKEAHDSSSYRTTEIYPASVTERKYNVSILMSTTPTPSEFPSSASQISTEKKSSSIQPFSDMSSLTSQSTSDLFTSWKRNETSTASYETTQNYSTSILDSGSTTSTLSLVDSTEIASVTTSRHSVEESSTVLSSSSLSSPSERTKTDLFSTSGWWTSLKINMSSQSSSYGTTQEYSPSVSDGEELSTTIASPTEVTKRIHKCQILTGKESGDSVTILFSTLSLQEEIPDEMRFQLSALSCLDKQLYTINDAEKNVKAKSTVDSENRTVYDNSGRQRRTICVSQTFTPKEQAYSITFYVINGSEEVIPASIVVQSLKSCKSKIEQDVGLNITDIFKKFQAPISPGKENIDEESVLQRHASLFISLSLVLGLLLIFGTVAFVYIYCCSHSRHYDAEKKKLKQDMSGSVEIGDMISANEILNGEKEMFGLVNGSSSHLIKMEDDGWVVPYAEIPLEEKNPPDVQDTKL